MSLLSQAAAQANTQELAIPQQHLITDAKTQARLKLDPKTVDEYATLLRTCLENSTPWPFPPVEVIRQTHVGAHFDYVWDGFHRIAAARQAIWPHPIPALVQPGTQRDAILAAVGANADHGLRRTNADKRRAVTILLLDEEWRQWSDNAIAERAHVSQPFVSKLRADLASTYNGYKSPATRTTAGGGKMNTSRIGNGRSRSSRSGKKNDTPPPVGTGFKPVHQPSQPDPRPRLHNYLTTIAGMFTAADEDEWADALGNTRLSDLRFLVKAMLKDLE